jgi:hypothetical protein
MTRSEEWEEKGIFAMDEKIAFLIFAQLEDSFTQWVESDKMPTYDKAQAHVKLYATMKSLLNDEALELWDKYKRVMQ